MVPETHLFFIWPNINMPFIKLDVIQHDSFKKLNLEIFAIILALKYIFATLKIATWA